MFIERNIHHVYFFPPMCLPCDSLEMTNFVFSKYKLNTEKTHNMHTVCKLSISSSDCHWGKFMSLKDHRMYNITMEYLNSFCRA